MKISPVCYFFLNLNLISNIHSCSRSKKSEIEWLYEMILLGSLEGLSQVRTKWKMKPLSRENWLNIALKKRQWWGKAYAVQLQTRKRVVNARYSARLLWNQLYVVWSPTLSACRRIGIIFLFSGQINYI